MGLEGRIWLKDEGCVETGGESLQHHRCGLKSIKDGHKMLWDAPAVLNGKSREENGSCDAPGLGCATEHGREVAEPADLAVLRWKS